MLDVRAALARDPVRIHRVLVRLPERRPEHAGLLRLAPRHVRVGERAHEALHGFHGEVPLARRRRGARNEPAPGSHEALLRVEPGRQAVALQQADERGGLAGARAEVGHHPASILRVHDRRVWRDGFARVTTRLAQHEHAPHHPGHQIDLGGFRHRLVNRAREQLSLAGAPAKQQRGDDGDRELLAGDVERVPHLRGDRWQIVRAARGGIVAAVHHHAPEREMDEVRALEAGPRAIVTERSHPRDDQRRVLLHQGGGTEPVYVELPLGCRLQQHVGGGDQRAELLLVSRLAQVEHDRTFAAVVLPEEEGSLGIDHVLVEGADAARGATAGRLHLDHIGAQPGQCQPAVLRLLIT